MTAMEQLVSVGKAAKVVGVDRKTLQRWLEEEQGLSFPRVGRGQVRLVRRVDVEAVVKRRLARQRWEPAEV